MSLEYDFDIVVSEDGTQLAMFRSPSTAEALRGADPAVRERR